ncbi:MAG: alpha/beta hydrolase [Alphaproteobacteria bacterium]
MTFEISLPVLLLPGLLNTERLWEYQVDTLPERYDCDVPDLTGAETITELAEMVLANAPGRFALIGLSMGGYVALEIMRQAPDRVAGLVLCCTSARPDDEPTLKRRKALIDLATRGRFRGVTPRLLPLLIAEDRLTDEAVTKPILSMAEEVGQAAFIRQQRAIMSRIDSRPSLSSIKCPTLIVSGEQDQLTPPDLQTEMSGLINGAEHVVLKDCGHLPPLEQPERLAVLFSNFLKTILR